MSASSPTADVSVRIAGADDAPVIAAVQVRAWRQEYADLLPAEIIAGLDEAAIAEGWRAALLRPADARNRVLVAMQRNAVRGYVVTAPSPDPDADPISVGELGDLVIEPRHRRAGHGSRLLQAAADTLRADRFDRGTCWLRSADDARRGFLIGAGWAPDGAFRELDLHGDGSVVVKQVRLHTDLRTD